MSEMSGESKPARKGIGERIREHVAQRQIRQEVTSRREEIRDTAAGILCDMFVDVDITRVADDEIRRRCTQAVRIAVMLEDVLEEFIPLTEEES